MRKYTIETRTEVGGNGVARIMSSTLSSCLRGLISLGVSLPSYLLSLGVGLPISAHSRRKQV